MEKDNRRFDLQQFFISANSSQERHDFNLDKFTDENIERHSQKLFNRKLLDDFYKWLDDLTEEEFDVMSLTDKCEKFFIEK